MTNRNANDLMMNATHLKRCGARWTLFGALTLCMGLWMDGPAFAGQGAGRAEAEQCLPDQMQVPAGAGPAAAADVSQVPIELEADQFEKSGNDEVVLTGNASVKQGAQSIEAQRISFDNKIYKAGAEGDVVFFTPFGDRIKTDRMDMEVDTRIGSADKSKFWFAERNVPAKYRNTYLKPPAAANRTRSGRRTDDLPGAKLAPQSGKVFVKFRGEADKIYFEGYQRERLQEVRLTSCNEGQDDVYLTATEVVLDHATGVGIAKNMKVRFFNVPIFYFPQVSFPITDERKSGFLAPGYGGKGGSGFVFQLPYYWNIAANHDVTITPRYMSKRGMQISTEYRYLTEHNSGRIEAEYLPSDNEFDDTDRYALSYNHSYEGGRKLRGNADLNYVSDSHYLDDFRTNVNITSATYLNQKAGLDYTDRDWRWSARASSFQTVDDQISKFDRPYSRLPELNLSYDNPQSRDQLFRYGFDSQAVEFTHDSNERVTGLRLNAAPYVSVPLKRVFGYVTPRLSLQTIDYHLDNQTVGESSDPTLAVPAFSLDSGLFFERATNWLGRDHTQTLEPRLFYLYIPDKNQDDLPVFDTSESTLNSYSEGFRENRFFGNDRVGDTNQLTLGLTSRLYDDESGEERLRASIGQIYFLSDRKVRLNPGDPRLTDSTSDIVGEVESQFTKAWRASSFVQWDHKQSEVSAARLDLDYEPDRESYYYEASRRRLFSMQYTYQRDSDQQVNAYLRWPLLDRWRVRLGEWYSIEDNKSRASEIGLIYDACCWSVTMLAHRDVEQDGGIGDAFFVTLEIDQLGRLQNATGF